MQNNYQIISSEEEIRNDILKNFRKRRDFLQTSFYLDHGSKNYYKINTSGRDLLSKKEEDQQVKFLEKHLPKRKKIYFISMGCGDAKTEFLFLKRLHQKKYRLSYIGVDSSEAMLKMAEKVLEKAKFEKHLVCVDFGSDQFNLKIRKLIKDKNGLVLFAFFGGTVGNFEQDFIADMMMDTTKENEYLLIDIVTRPSLSEKDNRLLFEKYRSYTEEKNCRDFFFFPLKRIGLRKTSGRFFCEIIHEEAMESLRFNINFKVQKKLKVIYKGHNIILLPNSILKLHTIWAYGSEGLIRFFKSRDFNFLGKSHFSQKKRGLFLFQKENPRHSQSTSANNLLRKNEKKRLSNN